MITFKKKTYTNEHQKEFFADLFNGIIPFKENNPHCNVLQSVVDRALSHKWKFTAKHVHKLVTLGYKVDEQDATQTGQPVAKTKRQPVNKSREFDAMVAKKYAEKFANATSRGIEFDLSFTEFKKLLRSNVCAYTGVAFVNQEGQLQLPHTRTIDRIDASKGYVKGNVAAITYVANQWKSFMLEDSGPKGLPQLSIDELINMLQNVKALSK